MPSIIQRSFAGGEVAPAMYARADQIKYATGLRTCLNFKVLRHGGVSNRSGFQFLEETKDSSRESRLLKFEFNSEQTYVIEAGHQYLRFFRNAGQIVVSGVAAWSNVTAYAIGDLAERLGVNYYCIQAHTNQQPPNATYWHPLTGDIYEIPTPYNEADLFDIQYRQRGDIITIVHPGYAPRELRRTGHTAWTLPTITFAPSISAPGSPGLVAAGTGSNRYYYCVTAVKDGTYEESARSSTVSDTSCDAPTEAAPHVFTWSAVSGAAAYNVYRGTTDGVFGFIAQVTTTEYRDNGTIVPDFTKVPPTARNPFSTTNLYPSAVAYFQQRRLFANSNTYTETIWGSKIGAPANMDISYPLQEDDALTYNLDGNKVHAVRHMLEVDSRFIVLTAGGEKELQGDSAGTLTPTQPNARGFGENGASKVAPVVVDNTAIFVQARGNTMRDIRYEVTDTSGQQSSYRGRDLSVFADHLFSGYEIVDMDYQKVPDSIVWAVRDDGILLGLTYMREHEIWAWHRHETEGAFESVVVVPEGQEDYLYAIVRRTINGQTKRYVERMHSRKVSRVSVDAFFVDSGLSYDGRNSTATTMTLSGGTTWAYTEELTLTASSAYFVAGDVGNDIVLRAGDDEIRFRIGAYSSGTVVTGNASEDVPVAFRNVAISNWGKAVDELSGLSHLEGEEVAILADGTVHPARTVSSGAITLDRPYEIVHVGIGYTCDLETLDIENVSGETLVSRKKRINLLTVYTQETRGLKAGVDEDNLKELPIDVDVYEDPDEYEAEKVEIQITSKWDKGGGLLIRQDDPLPITVLAIAPSGFIGG